VSVDILLIDDSEMHVNTLKKLLDLKGFKVEALLDPSHAITQIETIQPKLVILDIMMPGLDGLSLLSQLKAHRKTSEIPIVILTGKMFPPEKKKALTLGAVKYLTKPIASDSLLEEIKPYL
jgi:DNA-binding response OmpR family regulator